MSRRPERRRSKFCLLCHEDTNRLPSKNVRVDGKATGFRLCNGCIRMTSNRIDWSPELLRTMVGLLPIRQWWIPPMQMSL